MGFKLTLVFITLALVGAEQSCQEEKTGPCVENLLSVMAKDDISDAEACLEMRKVTNCLSNAADECLGDNRDVGIDKALEELEAVLEHNCPASAVREMGSVDVDVEACFVENFEYIMDCNSWSFVRTNTLLGNPKEVDVDVLQCVFSKVMMKCVKGRTEEMCGDKAGDRAEEEMADMIVKGRDACAAQSSIMYFTKKLADKKRK